MTHRILTIVSALALSLSAGCEWKFNGSQGGSPDEPLPGGLPGEVCASNSDCASGAICDATEVPAGAPGLCLEADTCDVSADCEAGFSCDPRNTCVFTGACSAEAPECTAGPGLYCNEDRGTCEANDPASVACEGLTTEGACADREDCVPVYQGLNCNNPQGESCTTADANCTCEAFVFDFCVAA